MRTTKIVCALLPLVGHAAMAQPRNPWQDLTYEDPVTQQKVVGIQLSLNTSTDGDLGNTGLTVRCYNNVLQIILA